MPLPSASQIVTQGNLRYFVQRLGGGADHAIKYGGLDGQYIYVDGATIPFGDTSRINVQDPFNPKKFIKVADEVSAPDNPTATAHLLRDQAGIPEHLYNLADCVCTIYQVRGICKDPSDFDENTDILIHSNGKITNLSLGGGAWDGDTAVEDTADKSFDYIYPTSTLLVGEKASTTVAVEVIDIVYGSRVNCAACGEDDDGTKLIYAVTVNDSGSPAVLPAVVYTVDGGATWTSLAITGIASTDIPVSIDIVGQKLMVSTNDGTDSALFVAEINDVTGIPSNWTKVTSGFVSSNFVREVHVENAREVYFAGANGYIYKTDSILSGVTVSDAGNATTDNLNDIHGNDNTIVAVGQNGAIVYSLNRGSSWAVPTNSPSANDIRAIHVINEFRWWAGDTNGVVNYTVNRGETAWTTITLTSTKGVTVNDIEDIVFVNDEIGYISASQTAPAAGCVFTTRNGGFTWTDAGGRLANFPTVDRINALAVPFVSNQAVASNNLAMAGLAGDGSDGVILIGQAEVK